MKIVHTLGWYFPESSGGTEVYVAALAAGLQAAGAETIVAAPAPDSAPADYEHQGIGVHRYPLSARPDRPEISGQRAPAHIDAFARWLEGQKADVYHQHSWSRGCGVYHLAAARALGLRTVVTIHVPAPICLRDTMLLDGRSVCDGRVDVARCSRCWGTARGMPSWLAGAVGRAPAAARMLGTLIPESSRVHTAVATPARVEAHRRRFETLVSAADRVVVVCEWLRDAALLNGTPPGKVMLCRQGVDQAVTSWPAPAAASGDTPLRIGFLGRLDPVKGLDLLIDAVNRLPREVPLELVAHGLPQDAVYARRLEAAVAQDSRIRLAAPVSREDLVRVLQGFDALAIPSRWLETGPLVALEALAAGIPVIGARRGGLAELIQDGRDGWLLPADDVEAWSAHLRTLARDPGIARSLRGYRPVRRMHEVCTEMLSLYRELTRSALAVTG